MGSLWGHFEVTLGSLFAYEGDSGAVWHHLAITVEPLWVYKCPLSKNIHFPNRFQWFYKMPGNDMSDRKANFAYDHVDSYAIWVHFGSTLAPFWVRFAIVRPDRRQFRFGSAPSRPQVGS